MLDLITVKKLSDKQIQDLYMDLGSKLDGATEATAEILYYQQDILRLEMDERRMMDDLRHAPMPTMNLTRDELSQSEEVVKDETKNKK